MHLYSLYRKEKFLRIVSGASSDIRLNASGRLTEGINCLNYFNGNKTIVL